MKKILIVNLTRFGDLLQTSPTIAGLKEAHPGAEITVVAERNFAEVCRGLPGVDRVWELDLDRLGHLILGGTGADLRAAYALVENEVHRLRAEHFDLALNYSSSRMSAVLMALIGVPDTRGWTMMRDGHRLIAHPWSRLFSASALHRRQAPFNLVDYYKRVAGVTAGPRRLLFTVSNEAEMRVTSLLVAAGHAVEPLVALQLGASRDARRWPAASFIALGHALASRLGARVVLCGGGGDRAVAEEVAAGLGPIAIDACGRTSIAELGALLSRVDVLVTSDTGPMHMAVAVDTPVVALFFGPALPFDTGPYGADHVCLHAEVACAPCDHNVTCLEPFCRDTLDPAAVVEAVVARCAGDWGALDRAADRWPQLRWYRTGFDPCGLFDVTLLGTRRPGKRELLRRAYRSLWKTVLDGAAPAASGDGLPDEAALVGELAARAAQASDLAAHVETLARRAPVALEELEAAARSLEELDAELLRMGSIHEPIALLIQLFRFEKESIAGEDVVALAGATRALHDEFADHARLLAALLTPTAPAWRVGGQHAHLH